MSLGFIRIVVYVSVILLQPAAAIVIRAPLKQ